MRIAYAHAKYRKYCMVGEMCKAQMADLVHASADLLTDVTETKETQSRFFAANL
jgi:hypothetical protein